MPLKHTTESAYVAALGIIIFVTGIALALIPALPAGAVYFGILVILTLVYPLALIPTFRTNRADYEFRLLHWFPLAMVLLWGLFQVLSKFASFFGYILAALTFMWSLPLVFLGILLLILFCFAVVRRRTPRVAFLATLFGIFLIAGALSTGMDWNDSLTAGLSRGPLALVSNGDSSSSETSSSEGSEASEASTASSSKSSARSSAKSSSSKARSSAASSITMGQASSRPTHLPEAGPGELGLIALTLMGLYSGVLHKRQR